MAEDLLFLTGKLAEKSLDKVLSQIQADPKVSPFKYRIHQIGVSVAALMTPKLIKNRLKETGGAEKLILPGLCQGDLEELAALYGIPVERGPKDLKDLPQYFGQAGQQTALDDHSVKIFAEVVDAPFLSVEGIVKKAQLFESQGANVIDLGCLPEVAFPHMQDTIQALHECGMQVSVDSLNVEDLLQAGQAGADFLLSLTEKTVWLLDEVASTPVLIPARPNSLPSLYRAIEHCQKIGRDFYADAILDPIHFGLTNSIVRYQKLRKKYPDIPIMMGVGNLTELTDADTTGINALLFGIVSELDINAVLATSVSEHAKNAILEADIARRTMYAAKQDMRLPRGYYNGLMGLHDKRPFTYSSEEIAATAKAIKDPSFRIQVSEEGMHIYNRDGLFQSTDPFQLYSDLKVDDDASHAFYLGVELARAQIAWQLGKRYAQDQALEWGVNDKQTAPPDQTGHREASLKEKRSQQESL